MIYQLFDDRVWSPQVSIASASRVTMLRSLRVAALLLLSLLSSPLCVAGELVTYYHGDILNSPVAATDAQGYTMWRAGYEPYGERIQTANDYLASGTNARWYTGHVQDVETGLLYMQARYYDPLLGRFMATDPAAVVADDPFTFNRYAYANDNPYKYVDPTGEFVVLPEVAAAVAVVALAVTATAYAVCESCRQGIQDFFSSALGAAGEGFDRLYSGVQGGSASATGSDVSTPAQPPGPDDEDALAASSAGARAGLDDLAQLRTQLGMKPGQGTLSRLDVGGRSYYGINAHGQEVTLRANAITRTHAEADVFQQAANANFRGGQGTLYVDRALCAACGSNGGVVGMARQLGLSELRVVTPQGTRVLAIGQ